MKRKLAVLLTAATVFSAILPTTCMAAEKKADIPEGTTISFWHAMGGVNGEALVPSLEIWELIWCRFMISEPVS